jgi:hypothetical protein
VRLGFCPTTFPGSPDISGRGGSTDGYWRAKGYGTRVTGLNVFLSIASLNVHVYFPTAKRARQRPHLFNGMLTLQE